MKAQHPEYLPNRPLLKKACGNSPVSRSAGRGQVVKSDAQKKRARGQAAQPSTIATNWVCVAFGIGLCPPIAAALHKVVLMVGLCRPEDCSWLHFCSDGLRMHLLLLCPRRLGK